MIGNLSTNVESSCELSIVMPCLNEAETISKCIEKAKLFLCRSQIEGEIVVADNGSSDGSVALAEQSGARVISVAERGYGAALRAGFVAARGRYVIMGDADDSYDFSRLDLFVARLRAGDQMVIGNRFAGGIADGAMPWHHKYVGNPVLSLIGRVFFGGTVRDFHCGLRGFEREPVLSLGLVSPGMELASEMVVKATLHGLRISEVPTSLAKDGRGRPPHLRSFRDGWRHLRFLMLHAPRWMLLYPAVAAIVIGVVLQSMLLTGPIVLFDKVGLDVHSMLYASGLTLIGCQSLILWIFCQYIAWRDNVLPQLPPTVRWINAQPVESFLIVGSLLFVSGFFLALLETSQWAVVGFGALNPQENMRPVILSLTLMVVGMQAITGALALAVLKLGEERNFKGRSNAALPPSKLLESANST